MKSILAPTHLLSLISHARIITSTNKLYQISPEPRDEDHSPGEETNKVPNIVCRSSYKEIWQKYLRRHNQAIDRWDLPHIDVLGQCVLELVHYWSSEKNLSGVLELVHLIPTQRIWKVCWSVYDFRCHSNLIGVCIQVPFESKQRAP